MKVLFVHFLLLLLVQVGVVQQGYLKERVLFKALSVVVDVIGNRPRFKRVLRGPVRGLTLLILRFPDVRVRSRYALEVLSRRLLLGLRALLDVRGSHPLVGRVVVEVLGAQGGVSEHGAHVLLVAGRGGQVWALSETGAH